MKALSKTLLSASVAFFAALSLVGCQAHEPVSASDPGNVAGRVRTVSGEPAADAKVYAFRDSSGSPVDSAKTDADGKYFLDLAKGEYDLYIDRKGSEGGRISRVGATATRRDLGETRLVPVIVTSVDLGLPQERIDSIRIPGSVLAGKVGADGKLGVPSLQGEEVVVKVSMKDEAGKAVSGTLKLRAVGGAMVVDWVADSSNALPVVGGAEGTHFGADTNTVALWSFDTIRGGVVYDRSRNGRNLSVLADGSWGRSGDSALTHAPTGKILYEARVKLSKYPSSSLHNSRAVVVGFYEGLKLVVTDHGQLQAGAQRGDGVWNWFAPETKDSLVPLGRWVDLAVGADQTTGDVYVWIDGKALPTWSGVKVAGSKIRVANSTFVVGKDAVDGQKFDGTISEVRVSRRFVLGAGIASGVDSCIDHLKPCKVPVAKIDTPVVKIDTPLVKIDTPKVVVPRKIDSLVAHWSVDSIGASTLLDRTGNGFDLKKLATGVWSRANDTNLTPKVTGQILYQAKVKLDKYPSSSLHNSRAVVVGFYEGLKLVVTDHGQLQAGAQRGDGTWNWFAPETKDSLVPLGKWVELAVGADQSTGDVYVWIDGKALPTWSGVKVAGSKIRVAASTFVVGKDAIDGQKFDGQIAEVKVWNKFVLGAGIASGVDSCIDHLKPCKVPVVKIDTPVVKIDTPKVVVPRKIDSLVAHWNADSSNASTLVDRTGNGFDLKKLATGVWSRASDTNLTPKVTGRILYQAKVKLSKYPSSSLHNGRAVVVGFYEGLKLVVTDHGQLQAGAQRGDGTWNWFAPETKDSLVPLGKWVELAVGADQSTGDVYVWIDGKALPTWSGAKVAGSKIRVATSTFVVGQDAIDGQKFDGQIAEVKVWNKFVLGAGIASGVDSCIDHLKPCKVPVAKIDTPVVKIDTPVVKIDTPKVVVPRKIDSLVAHWSIDSIGASTLLDRTGNGFDLKKLATGVWSHANDTFLTPKVTGQILYQAKVWLDKYPSSSLHNGRAVVVGFYEGLKLLVNDHGQIQAGAQRGDGGWSWFAPETKANAMPLGKWVELAVGADQSTGDVYVWIDGKALPTWSGSHVAGSKIRVATSAFVVGQDATDGQKFDGKIAEVKVWNKFVLGAGIASGVDPNIDL